MEPALAYDTETTGLYPFQGAEMFSYSTCDEDAHGVVQRLDGSQLRQLQGRRKLAALWSDENMDVAKVMHNAKFDLHFTEKYLGRRMDGHRVHCTHKMSHILQNHHHNHSLDYLAWEIGEYPRIDAKVKKMARLCGGFNKVPEDKMDAYQLSDAERTMFVYLFFWPKINSDPKWRECYDMEMELIWTTMRMEARGLMVNRPKAEGMIGDLRTTVDRLREELFTLVGRRFNPDSSLQLRRVLYKDLGLPVLKLTKKSKKPSTDKLVFMELREKFDHPIFNLILRIRSYSKGATAVQSYLDIAGPSNIIHPTINTCGAITSRESSENPNLQNVQKAGVLLNPYPVLARDAFRPKPGFVNLHVDYAGIEGRLIIHYSQDEAMLECLNDGDGDIHYLAGSFFYRHGGRWADSQGATRKMLRDAAKNANFAAPYGAANAKLSAILGLSGRAAEVGIRAYRARFPRYSNFFRTIAKLVKRDGFVTTAFGRRLHIPRDEAYVGANYLIQCTGTSEILKHAQNRVHKYNVEATGEEVGLILPIHDELVIEYPRARMSDLPGYLRDIRALMIDFPMFSVPLEIEAEVSTASWARKRPLEIAV